jgi:alkylation response protein AidB-like acyl-CoA dehydrogenase
MQACMDVVVPYVHTRKQFGKPIGEFQVRMIEYSKHTKLFDI